MKINLFFSLVTLFVLFPLFSYNQESRAIDYLNKKGEVYFIFETPSSLVLSRLANIVSIDKIEQDKVYAYANKHEFEKFLKFDIQYRVLDHPGDVDFDLNMKTWEQLKQKKLTENWDFYPTYDAYVDLMYWYEKEYPELVKIVNIGQTVMGRDMLFAKISPQVETKRPVPQFMYTSTMHGDETAGFVLSLRLIHHLISNYGVDDDITTLMDNVEIWICPNENPDGTYTDDNTTVNGSTRYNANNIDLNRNYPNPISTPDSPTQPETEAMISFTDTMNFIMSANMHGGIELVNYPFDSWESNTNKHADHDWWEFVMNEYVDTVHKNSPSGYMTDLGGGVTHGGDWWVIYGSRQDYFNYYRSCREFTLELSKQKLLDPQLLPDHWEYNYRSLINYIQQSTFGVHGFVYCNNTNKPLQAEISIHDYDRNNSEISTSMPFGNYNRPLLEGVYDIIFIADGYAPDTLTNVEVLNYNITNINAFLEPFPSIAVSPGFLDFSVGIAGNVYSKELTIKNTSKADVNIIALSLDGDEVFYFDLPVKSTEFVLEPGDETTIELFFLPEEEKNYTATLLIESNDHENPELEVIITGKGVISSYVKAKDHKKALLNIYPNPVNNNTKIDFYLDAGEIISLYIYNINGELIDIIHEGYLNGGDHSFALSGFFDDMEDGIKFITLRKGYESFSKRIIKFE